MHWRRMKRYGVLDAPRVPTMQERFWAKVDKQGENGCWLWTASINPKTGYGQSFLVPCVGKNCP